MRGIRACEHWNIHPDTVCLLGPTQRRLGPLRRSIKCILLPNDCNICLHASLVASAGPGGLESRDLEKLQGPTHPPTLKASGESLDEHGEESRGQFDPPLGRREDIDAWKRWKTTTTTFSQKTRISRNRTSRNVGTRSGGGTFVKKTFQGALGSSVFEEKHSHREITALSIVQ
ncbi:hypothetical protein CPC08DRAFT_161660 [Agrocybe pediades]|nr:hypothetical protein CPC08DRAFT_161660 [Agrocybe pediades]